MNNIKVSENFKLYEFQCKCGEQHVKLDEELLYKLQKLRDRVGVPIVITSGYRCPEYNKKIGGAEKSQHMYGTAVDIQVKGYTPTQVAKLAEEIGFNGIGIYNTFCHIDIRSNPARWNG